MTDRNVQRVVAVSFGLLCVLQVLLNIYLRLMIYNETPNVNESCNATTEDGNIQDQLDPYFQQGWIYFQTSLYYISPMKKTWKLSRIECLQRGADLVVINNRAEQGFVRKLKNDLWIGLMDQGSNRSWRWVDGTPLSKSYWNEGEPNNFEGLKEDCVVANYQKGWNDVKCERQNFCFCEKTISPSLKV